MSKNKSVWLDAGLSTLSLTWQSSVRTLHAKEHFCWDNSNCIIFLPCFESTTTGLCTAEGVRLLERIQVWNKSVDSLVHIRSARFFGGKTQLGAGGVKRYVKRNDGAETFSPGDFLRHGGHEGSGYSAVWKVLNGCLFKLQACAAAWCLGWQITHSSLKRLRKKKASRASALRHGQKVVMDGASDVTASRSGARCCVSVQTLATLRTSVAVHFREKIHNDVTGGGVEGGKSLHKVLAIFPIFLFYFIFEVGCWGGGVGWIPVGLSGDAAIINRQSEGRASVHKGMAERSEIIEADSSPGGEDYLCSPLVRK